jgi:uncharacterized protein (TIGR02145 family)
MKKNQTITTLLLLLMLFSCSTNSDSNGNSTTTVPTLTTIQPSIFSSTNSASIGGNISSDGGATITARGVCWSNNPNPTIALSTKTIDGSGIGSFTTTITGLSPNTTFYVRAYATNNIGTAYGNEFNFNYTPIPPTVYTDNPTAISSTSAISGGYVGNDGGANVTSRGVVWSTSPNPTIALSTKTVDGYGMGSFNSTITGLSGNTTYYVKSYATNNAGTAYGNEVSFTTLSTTMTDIDGNNYQTVTICNQTWTKTNLNVSHYRNGDVIPQVTDPYEWYNLNYGAWCYYNNDPANETVYGKLYNWYAVNDPRGLAPLGYHIPTDAEYTTLSDCLGGNFVAGGKIKETGYTHWLSPNLGASNSSGFTARGGGGRSITGQFNSINSYGSFWSSSDYGPDGGNLRVTNDYQNITIGIVKKHGGGSVRCVKD